MLHPAPYLCTLYLTHLTGIAHQPFLVTMVVNPTNTSHCTNFQIIILKGPNVFCFKLNIIFPAFNSINFSDFLQFDINFYRINWFISNCQCSWTLNTKQQHLNTSLCVIAYLILERDKDVTKIKVITNRNVKKKANLFVFTLNWLPFS